MEKSEREKKVSPWRWVPTLYFCQGIPFVFISMVSVILYKDRGISNTDIAFFTSWLYLPWVIKGLWGPFVEMFATRREWILLMQFIMGVGFGMIGLLLPLPFWFMGTLIFFWLLAFASATHDIAADGFYMDALTPHQQVWFTGIRNTFYRFAMIAAEGGLVMFVGWVDATTGPEPVPVTLSAPGITAPAINCLDTLTAALTDTEAVFNGELPEIHCEQRHVMIPAGKINDNANRKILDFITQWNDVEGQESAAQLQEKLSRLRAEISQLQQGSSTAPQTGELVIIPYRLSAPPEQTETIQTKIGFLSGDKGVELIAGERHQFHAGNWLKPAFAVFRYGGEKLDSESVSQYIIRGGNHALAWGMAVFLLCLVYCCFAAYHLFALPGAESGKQERRKGYLQSFVYFFKLPSVWITLGFVLLYRFGEAQLVKISAPFLMDSRIDGGLALTTGEVGFILGTVGTTCLLAGGILGSFAVARHGLRAWIWPMACAIHLPNLVYVYLAWVQPENMNLILGSIAIEQFGYGFGFAGFMLYLLWFVKESPMRTAHYALLTGFMSLGMMIPGMFSGWLQELMGYPNFFIWIVISTVPGFLIILGLKIPKHFGIRGKDEL